MINETIIRDKNILANSFNNYFGNIGTQMAKSIPKINSESPEKYLTKPINTQFQFRNINERIVKNIIKNLKCKRNSGHDGLSMFLLKQPENFTVDLSKAFDTLNHQILLCKLKYHELNHAYEWLCINKLSLNIKKTKYIMFHSPKKKIQEIQPRLVINDINIEQVKDFNFLGITIEEHLNWKLHIDKMSKKISRAILAL